MIEILKKVGIFSSVPEKNLAGLADVITWKDFKKGEYLFNEGDPAHYMYIIASGRVKVVKEFASGKNAIMGIFEPGGAVAEVVVIDKLPYPAAAVAMEDTRAGAVPADAFVSFIMENPEALLRMVAGLGKKLRDFVDNLGSLAVQSVEKRLARLLTRLAREIGKKKNDELVMTLTMTRQDMAEIIGTSFEVVERGLKKMKQKGVISAEGKRITIHKPDELKAIFEQ